VIFDIVEYIIILIIMVWTMPVWTMPNESRICRRLTQDELRRVVGQGAYPSKKKSVAGQFAAVKYRSETYWWTQKLKREDYGLDKYWARLAVVKVQTLLKNNKHCCVHLTNLAGRGLKLAG
jgi:hypothetical protein